jgi:ParB family transcriptional regulator, chromosome partitioning protein
MDMKNSAEQSKEKEPETTVLIKKIVDPDKNRKIDLQQAYGIAESVKITGFIHPIAVKKISIGRGSEARKRVLLVAGAHRLEAARHLGHERIPCKYVDGDETFVQLVKIGEDLFRKHVTILRRSELLAKWYDLLSKEEFSGQLGQKGKRGRPKGGISMAARNLPIGSSMEARRKLIQRAHTIARIKPQAKEAAIKAGLEDNQEALLAVAKAQGRKAQLRKIEVLAKSSSNRRDKIADAEGTTIGKRCKAVKHGKTPKHADTTIDQLEELWKKHGRELWKYAPFVVREEFLGTLRKAKCKAMIDAVQFVRDAFQGRKQVFVKALYVLAKRRGLSEKSVRAILKQLGYHRTRPRLDPSSGWRYRNTNKSWEDEIPVFRNPALSGFHEAEDTPEQSTSVTSIASSSLNSGKDPLGDAEYFKL